MVVFINKDLCEKCLIYEKGDIKKAISAIEKGGLKIALVLNNKNQLLGTICDGDIRRGLLTGLSIESPLSKVIKKECIVAYPTSSRTEIIKLMKDNGITQIPIISDNGELIGLEILEEILPNENSFSNSNNALLMAGGRGTRLKPLTDDCPKPLIRLNGKPILEIILEKCIEEGINNFFISIHYLGEMIIDYFGDGSKWNVNIEYVKEDKPLGTAGALSLLPKDLKNPILIINGDVLTKTNIVDLFYYHSTNNADITICAREHVLNSPYGVLEVEGIKFKSIIEKPSFKQLVNAGIYILNPEIINLIEHNKYLDMPDLISRSKSNLKNIVVYPVHEYWLDIGRPESLNKANYDLQQNILK